MYKHVLVATDGSAYALRAAKYGLQVAKAHGARATAITVTPPWHAISLSEIALGHDEAKYAANMALWAEQTFSKLRGAAKEIGVSCQELHITHDRAYQAIIDAAVKQGCDLIVVGSHGRRGIEGLVLGSETVKVLTHSRIPVLVYRE